MTSPDNPYTPMAEFVADQIFKKKLIVENVAEKSNIPIAIFSKLMSGNDKRLKDRHIPLLANALHCQKYELISRVTNIPITTRLGELINNERRRKGLTQTALAAKNNWLIRNLQRLESEKSKIRHIDARMLTKNLGIKPGLFVPFLSELTSKTTSGNGAKIRRLRQSALLSVSELAELLNLTRQAVSLYEHNSCRPSATTMQKIYQLPVPN